MKAKLFSVIVAGVFLGTMLSSEAVIASGPIRLGGTEIGTVFLDGNWYELRFLKGKSNGVCDQILLYDLSRKAIGTLAFKIHPNPKGGAVIENPLPIVTGESDLSEIALFTALYTGLFSYCMQMTPEAVAQGLRIEFTDVPEGAVHPAITLPLQQFGFEPIGGRTITVQMPQTSPLSKGGTIQVPQLRSIHFELSNRYRLTNQQELIAQISNMISGGGN